ncbi:MAG: hypothetical protein RLO17_22970 [Cyclobacteriaceae bacterium]
MPESGGPSLRRGGAFVGGSDYSGRFGGPIDFLNTFLSRKKYLPARHEGLERFQYILKIAMFGVDANHG